MDKRIAEKIIAYAGGEKNVQNLHNCMTRVRFTAVNSDEVDIEGLKSIDGVLGVQGKDDLQVIVGPGHAQAVTDEMSGLMTAPRSTEAANVKKSRETSTVGALLKRIGNIFIPLIPALVASGLINGIVAFSVNAGVDPKLAWVQILQFIGGAFFTILGVMVGYNTAKEFGGTPALGAISGALIFNPALDTMKLFDITLKSGRGGLFAVLLSAFLMAVIEKQVRKIVPKSLDIIVTSTITVLITGLITVIGLQPIGAFISNGITSFINALLDIGGPFAGAVLSGTFLPLVMVGLHHGLTPIHLEFIQKEGMTPILTILAMAGAGQVGAAIAIFIKTKNQKLKNIIKAALPVGFLGIGEPLLYGVTLPLGRPFITACIGASFGGAYQAFMHTGAINIGVSGLSLIPLIANNMYIHYIIGLLLAYAGGFVCTYFFGYNESQTAHIEESEVK